jgi:signal transduction histidine kinase
VCPDVPVAPSDTHTATQAGEKPLPKSNQLASHLQAGIEVERSQLARQLHDDLGGLLVGALMDVAWVEARLQAPDLQAKLGRARDSLRAAVDLKRNLIEAMRPTLLENVGIFAAMRWHFAKYCGPAALACIANFPVAEPTLKPNVAIGVYRITEEALRLISGPLQARSITLDAEVHDASLTVQFSHDGAGLSAAQLAELPEYKSMSERISTLHGKFTVGRTAEGALQWHLAVAIDPQAAG